MRRQSLAIWLPILLIAGAESHGWNFAPEGYLQPQMYPQPQRSQQPGSFEVYQGTIDQLNDINAQWICTNQKSGDMIVIGTDNANTGNVNFQPQPQQPTYNRQQSPQPGYPRYPQQQVPQYNPQQPIPQNPQLIPQNPQQQIPQNPQQQIPQNPQQQIPQNPQQQIPQNPQQQIPQNPQQQIPQNPQNPQQQGPKNPGFPDLPWTVLPGTTTTDPLKKFDNFDWTSYVTTAASTRGSGQAAQNGYEGEGIVEPRSGIRG